MADRIQMLEARVASLEEMVFRIQPSEADAALDTLDAIRSYLRRVEPECLSPGAVRFICERLPVDWRDLAKRNSPILVFRMLADSFNIVDARRRLR